MRNKTTLKKVKQVGVQEYLDVRSGDLVPLQVSHIEERDFNFYKIWLGSLVESFEAISSQKTKVAFWILLNLNKENQLVYTQEQVSAKTGASIQTVNNTFQALVKSDLLRKIDGIYMANPDIIFKGTTKARNYSLSNYANIKKVNHADIEKLATIESKIEQLEKRAEALRAKVRTAV